MKYLLLKYSSFFFERYLSQLYTTHTCEGGAATALIFTERFCLVFSVFQVLSELNFFKMKEKESKIEIG